MKIMILGAGLVGYNLGIGFYESDYDVLIVDKKNVQKTNYFKFKQQNIKNRLEQLFEKEKPNVVYYLIDEKLERDNKNLLYYIHLDIYNFIQVLNLCVQHKVKKIISLSWYELSPDECSGCINSNKYSLPNLDSKYINKFTNELYCQYFKDNHGLDFVSLRMPEIYGYKKLDFWSNNIVDTIVRKSLKNKLIELDANKEDCINLLYIGDAVTALIYSLKDDISGIYNVTGKFYTYEEVVKEICKFLKVKVNFTKSKIMNRVKEKYRITFLNCYGWKPIVSLLGGINVTYNHIIKKNDF